VRREYDGDEANVDDGDKRRRYAPCGGMATAIVQRARASLAAHDRSILRGLRRERPYIRFRQRAARSRAWRHFVGTDCWIGANGSVDIGGDERERRRPVVDRRAVGGGAIDAVLLEKLGIDVLYPGRNVRLAIHDVRGKGRARGAGVLAQDGARPLHDVVGYG